jgi:hypothetical protein
MSTSESRHKAQYFFLVQDQFAEMYESMTRMPLCGGTLDFKWRILGSRRGRWWDPLFLSRDCA